MVRAVNPPLPRGWGEGAPRAGASAPQAGATPSLYELSCRALAEALWRQEITSLGTLLPQDALLRIFRLTLERGRLDERILRTLTDVDAGLMSELVARLGIQDSVPPIIREGRDLF
jgi:hypothetical protein